MGVKLAKGPHQLISGQWPEFEIRFPGPDGMLSLANVKFNGDYSLPPGVSLLVVLV